MACVSVCVFFAGRNRPCREARCLRRCRRAGDPRRHLGDAKRASRAVAGRSGPVWRSTCGRCLRSPRESSRDMPERLSRHRALGCSALVTQVDGAPRVRPHRLLVERGGCLPAERDVDVPLGATATVSVVFEPTPETRARHAASAESRRFWSWMTIGAGAAVAVGGVAVRGGSPHRAKSALERTEQPECSPRRLGQNVRPVVRHGDAAYRFAESDLHHSFERSTTQRLCREPIPPLPRHLRPSADARKIRPRPRLLHHTRLRSP
jgi:hypothetical protein